MRGDWARRLRERASQPRGGGTYHSSSHTVRWAAQPALINCPPCRLPVLGHVHVHVSLLLGPVPPVDHHSVHRVPPGPPALARPVDSPVARPGLHNLVQFCSSTSSTYLNLYTPPLPIVIYLYLFFPSVLLPTVRPPSIRTCHRRSIQPYTLFYCAGCDLCVARSSVSTRKERENTTEDDRDSGPRLSKSTIPQLSYRDDLGCNRPTTRVRRLTRKATNPGGDSPRRPRR